MDQEIEWGNVFERNDINAATQLAKDGVYLRHMLLFKIKSDEMMAIFTHDVSSILETFKFAVRMKFTNTLIAALSDPFLDEIVNLN
jgi:hypothetical protein